MATAIAFNSESPHSLVVSTAGDGVAGAANRAAVLGACAEGPLKALLTKVADWTVFNLTGALCSAVHVREVVERSSGPEPISSEFFWTATGIKVLTGAATFRQFEIRLAHSSRF